MKLLARTVRTVPTVPTVRTVHSGLMACTLCIALLVDCAPAQAAAAPDWARFLQRELKQIDADFRHDVGVYVRDLDSGQSVSWRADETWYLASTVKLPVALTVLQHVQQDVFSLDTTVTLRADDYVDGGGSTLRLPVGARPTVRWLLEQMMVHSDNTATDMLIDLVGLRSVNALVLQAVPNGLQPITTMADVRRHIYTGLTPAASRLSGEDFLQLHAQRSEQGRRQLLSRLLQVPTSDFRLATLAEAYENYYASGLNSGRLDAYSELLTRLAQGSVLDAPRTAWLLALMERAQTGAQRVRAGLPKDVRWAHKTGTQFARTCDVGVMTVPHFGRDQRVVVAACTRGERSLARAERALMQVGAAICRSGLFGAGRQFHDASCRPDATPPHAPPAQAAAQAREPGSEPEPESGPGLR